MKITQKQQVYEAVIELHSKEMPASRITIAELLGIKQTAVDDCLKDLADDERIYRVASGIYAPCVQHPPQRTIYKTILPDGTVKLEVGDDNVLTLTPAEARKLGGLMYAEATEYGLIALSNRMREQEHAFSNRLKKLEKELNQKPIQESLL